MLQVALQEIQPLAGITRQVRKYAGMFYRKCSHQGLQSQDQVPAIPYCQKAVLFHQPNVLIMESSTAAHTYCCCCCCSHPNSKTLASKVLLRQNRDLQGLQTNSVNFGFLSTAILELEERTLGKGPQPALSNVRMSASFQFQPFSQRGWVTYITQSLLLHWVEGGE